jgi:hypothetical protein
MVKTINIRKLIKKHPELIGTGIAGVPLALLLAGHPAGFPLSLATAGGLVTTILIDEGELKKELGRRLRKLKKVI